MKFALYNLIAFFEALSLTTIGDISKRKIVSVSECAKISSIAMIQRRFCDLAMISSIRATHNGLKASESAEL